MIRKKIYLIYKFFFTSLSIAGCYFNIPFLSALSWKFLLYKNKNIKNSKNKNKITIILDRTIGRDDIIESYRNFRPKRKIYFISRENFKLIFDHFFYKDYKLHKNIDNFEIKLNKYNLYLKKLLNSLKYLLPEFNFVTFNYNYSAEAFFFQECKKQNIDTYLFYKECFRSPAELEVNPFPMYSKFLKNFSKILVYNQMTKFYLEKLTKDKIKILVNGLPRFNFFLNQSNKIKKKKITTLTFFLIENKKGIPNKKKFKSYNWNEINLKILNYLTKLSNLNRKIKIIVKAKNGKLIPNILKQKKNKIIFSNSGSGANILKNSDLIISLNSAATLESIASKKHILIPFFGKKTYEKKIIYNYDKTLIYKNEKKFFKQIQNMVDKKNIKFPASINNYDKMMKDYFGNYKQAGKIMRLTIDKS